jgi:hypothetical protein
MAENDPTIDGATAGRLIRVTNARISQLAKEGWIKREANGKYLVVNVVHGYLDFLDDVKKREAKSASASRVQDERAALYKQQRLEKAGKLCDVDEVIAFLWEVFSAHKSECSSVASRATRDRPLRKKIEAELDDAFNRTAARFETARATLGADGDTIPSGSEDDA